MRSKYLLLAVALYSSSMLRAEIDYPITPDELRSQVESRGLAQVHDEIFSHPYAVNMVLLAIDSAESDWLAIAELFLKEENLISGPRLIMALGEGLQWQPASVLEYGFPIERICSLEGLYEWRRFSLFLSNKSIQRRLAALDALVNADEKVNQCRNLLIRTQKSLPSTMTNKLPEHYH